MAYILDGLFRALELLLFGHGETYNAIATTVKVTTLSMTASLIMGIPLGFLLGYSDFWGKRLIRAIVETLLAFPTVLIGLLVYAFISRRGPLGELGLLFTIPGMAIGQTILALPIVVALTTSAVEALDRRLRLTLLTLGAGGAQVAMTSLWEARYAVLVAAVTAYGRVISEVASP